MNTDTPMLPDCTDCSRCTTPGGCGSCDGCGSGGAGEAGFKPAESLSRPEETENEDPEENRRRRLARPSDFKFEVDREPRGKIFATNWLDPISTSADFPAVQVQFKNTRNAFYLNPSKLNLEIGDMVVVEAAPNVDVGRVSMIGPLVRHQMRKAKVDPDSAELKKVLRKATPADLQRFEEARAREHDTMIRSRVIAEELGLNMKIGDVEYQGDGTKAIFYYIADERVDFRKLIRILADEFHVRIEMKQIGARQEAGRIGGIGPCGRPLCCSSWMTHFVSVGTGAARTQDLSMNPQKLAGQCAKLKCCLNFEIDSYAESARKLPPRDFILQTKDADYFYFKADILQRLVSYSTDKKMPVNLVTIPAARAFEIMALNRQGVKVDRLEAEGDQEEAPREYIDLTDQDSLTRFDRSGKRKKKRQQAREQKEPKDQREPREQKETKEPREQKEQEEETPRQPRRQKPPRQRQGEPRQPHAEQRRPQNDPRPRQQAEPKHSRPRPNRPQRQKQNNDRNSNPGTDR